MARPDRLSLGKMGEDLACRELARRGYAILARRFRTRLGEIDIIAHDGPTLVFVEVKTRSSAAFGRAAEAVTVRKQAKIGLMAAEYLLRRGLSGTPCRFDVVAVLAEQGRAPAIELIRGAFDARAYHS
jgi:putative endonuclease